MPSVFAFPWWSATFYLGLSDSAEVAAITGFFGMVSSVVAAYFGYKTMMGNRASRAIEVTEEHGPVVRPPDPALDKENDDG